MASGPQRVQRGSGPRWKPLAAVAAVVVLVGALGVALNGGSDDAEPVAAASSTSTTEPERQTEIGNASQAFAIALRQVEEGGSFSYEGWAHAADATYLRPTTVFPTPVAVEGEVLLPRRVHEIASDGSDTVHESIIVGTGFWERTASVDAGPSAAPPYGEGQRGSLDMGAALLPTWLREATDRAIVDDTTARSLGADDDLRLFGGLLVLTGVETPLQIFISLDPADVLTHVWIASADAPFFVDWDITGIGEPVTVDAPGPLPDAAVGFGPAELATAGIDSPVQLTQVPTGWVLADAWIAPDTPSGGCSTLNLDYHPVDEVGYPAASAATIELDITSDDCAPPDGGPDIGFESTEPITVGEWTGNVWVGESLGEGFCDGTLSNGTTTIHLDADLSLEATRTLLASLAPFDPAVQPDEIDIR